jgi:hypothetical protein
MKDQPASQFATTLMFLLPSKRHICIHTICKGCVHVRQFVFPDEQIRIIWEGQSPVEIVNANSLEKAKLAPLATKHGLPRDQSTDNG